MTCNRVFLLTSSKLTSLPGSFPHPTQLKIKLPFYKIHTGYVYTQSQCQVYKQTEKALPQSQILSYGDVPRNPIARSLYNIQSPFNSRSRRTKKLGGEPLLLPGLGSPSHTSRKASGHLTWVMVTVQCAHPHHHRHGWTQAEEGNFGLLVPTWRESLRAGLSLSPPDAALGPREPEQSYQGFLLYQPPLKGTREMAGCLGREEEGTTRGIRHLLCLVGRNSGAGAETATPRGPQGMGDPTGGKGGGRRATGSQRRCNQPGLPVRRPHQQTPILGA